MLIQEFCRVTGLGRETVRFYVRKGLLQPRVGAGGGNRYQVFDEAQVERARLIRAGQALGFTLAELAELAVLYERRALTRARKAEVLRTHLAALDERAALLAEVRRYVRAKLAWLEDGEQGPAPVLEQRRAAGITGRPSQAAARTRSRTTPTARRGRETAG